MAVKTLISLFMKYKDKIKTKQIQLHMSVRLCPIT